MQRPNCCIIVDLDFTLVNLDTTAEFLKLLCPLKYYIFSKILRPVAILGRILSIDLYKQLMLLLCIYDHPKELLEEKAKILFKMLVSKEHVNVSLLNFIKKKNCVKVLLTCSLDIIATQFYDFEFDLIISSTSLFRHGKFIKLCDLYGKKHRVVHALSRLFHEVVILEDSPENEYHLIKNARVIRVIYGRK